MFYISFLGHNLPSFFSLIFPIQHSSQSPSSIFYLHVLLDFKLNFTIKLINHLFFSMSDRNINLNDCHTEWLTAKSDWYYLSSDYILPKYFICYIFPDPESNAIPSLFFMFWVINSRIFWPEVRSVQFYSISLSWCLRCQYVIISFHASLCWAFPVLCSC